MTPKHEDQNYLAAGWDELANAAAAIGRTDRAADWRVKADNIRRDAANDAFLEANPNCYAGFLSAWNCPRILCRAEDEAKLGADFFVPAPTDDQSGIDRITLTGLVALYREYPADGNRFVRDKVESMGGIWLRREAPAPRPETPDDYIDAEPCEECGGDVDAQSNTPGNCGRCRPGIPD